MNFEVHFHSNLDLFDRCFAIVYIERNECAQYVGL